MCDDWITETYVNDLRHAANKHYLAVKRLRELAEKFEQEPQDEMVNYHLIARRIFTAIKDGDQQ